MLLRRFVQPRGHRRQADEPGHTQGTEAGNRFVCIQSGEGKSEQCCQACRHGAGLRHFGWHGRYHPPPRKGLRYWLQDRVAGNRRRTRSARYARKGSLARREPQYTVAAGSGYGGDGRRSIGGALIKRNSILLADDHALILAGIRGLLNGNYDVVVQVGDGRSLVDAALRLKPDLIILDISMPLLNGIEAARHIKKAWPEAKLLFLTMHASPAYLKEAMDAGGMGYIVKSSANEELRTALHKPLRGQVYITPSFDQDVLEAVQASCRARPRPSVPFTFRQAEVLQLVAEGWGNKEIADLLKVSVKTVDFHRGRIMRKLGAHNVAELVRYAVQAGMVGV